ncbi:MAG TPA: acyl-CoA dehydrogenase [Phenylobacterium sp.]|nr:acyl-CoA dehydrogenase [Phenylobacterium sp.]
MNFELTVEQVLLKEALRRLLADHYRFESRRRLVSDPCGWSSELWSHLADMGVLGAAFAEADGGQGGGPVETLVIGEALGAVLSAEPYLASVVLAGTALRLSTSVALRRELAPQVAGGGLVLACGVDGERPQAAPGDGGWVLSGCCAAVIHGDSADRIVVPAEAAAGLVLLVVDPNAAGVSRRAYRTFDGLRAADIIFDGAHLGSAAELARGDEAVALFERVVQHGIAYLAAEATGLMSMLLDTTVEHLKTRMQFGQPLSKFQALQHRCAEMLVALEQARSMSLYAAAMVDNPDAAERRKAFAAVKAVIANAGRFVGQNAVQLHGGVGVTEEHPAGWGLKRLTMIDLMFGDADAHTAALARLGGFVEAA